MTATLSVKHAEPARATVAICAGKDCRERCEFAKLRRELDRECNIIELKCVGICSGPVVVADPMTDTPVVLAKVRTKRQRRQFVDMATSGTELPSSLSHLQVSSKKRQKVSKALDRATTRNKRR